MKKDLKMKSLKLLGLYLCLFSCVYHNESICRKSVNLDEFVGKVISFDGDVEIDESSPAVISKTKDGSSYQLRDSEEVMEFKVCRLRGKTQTLEVKVEESTYLALKVVVDRKNKEMKTSFIDIDSKDLEESKINYQIDEVDFLNTKLPVGYYLEGKMNRKFKKLLRNTIKESKDFESDEATIKVID